MVAQLSEMRAMKARRGPDESVRELGWLFSVGGQEAFEGS
jgi:hypothetical protein